MPSEAGTFAASHSASGWKSCVSNVQVVTDCKHEDYHAAITFMDNAV